MPRFHTRGRDVLLAGLRPSTAALLARWLRDLGRPAAECSVREALAAARVRPLLAVICSGQRLRDDPALSETLHRRQLQTALVTLEDGEPPPPDWSALACGAIDRLMTPVDRERLETVLARAERWAAGTDASARRALVVRLRGRTHALERRLSRLPVTTAADFWRWVEGGEPRSNGWPPWLRTLRTAVDRESRPGAMPSASSLLSRRHSLSQVLTFLVAERPATRLAATELRAGLAHALVCDLLRRLHADSATPAGVAKYRAVA